MHKKYIKIRGKKFGPYFYMNVRHGDKTETIYLGTSRNKALQKAKEIKAQNRRAAEKRKKRLKLRFKPNFDNFNIKLRLHRMPRKTSSKTSYKKPLMLLLFSRTYFTPSTSKLRTKKSPLTI